MARARNIKPGFFSNDVLVDLPFEVRLLFIGLWTIADKAGRLMDRPKKIKMEIFPADNVDCDQALSMLAERGFLIRYEAEGARCIQIVNWSKHQNPHIKEAPSVIPEFPGSAPEIPVQAPVDNQTNPADSGFLIPDSPSLIPDTGTSAACAALTDPPELLDFKLAYPDRAGGQPWRRAVKAINARLSEGSTWNQIMEGARRYAAYCEATGKLGTEFVMQAATFVGPDRHFLSDWKPPATKADVRQNKNLSASQQWLAEQEAKDAAR